MDAMFFIVLGATLVSFLLTLAFGRFVIPMLRALHAGQSIREVGPQWHNSKAGTPTMGGIMFIAAILLCTVGFGWKSMVENADYTHLYVLGLALCYGLVGFADDFVKVKLKRNLGLTASQKFLLQLVVAVIFLFVLKKSGDLSCDLYIPFWNLDLEIPTAVYMIFAAFVIVGCVNAVNLTDGLDGLAILPSVMVGGALGIFAYVVGRPDYAGYLIFPYIPGAGELVVIAGGLLGAGLAFLWYNAHPAQVFMGDVGALALGGCLGTMAVITRQELVLAVMGGIFVVETLSVMIQTVYFRLSHGKRIFLMAPVHHHFELKGWKETQVVTRFWIITMILVLIGLSTLKIR